jgi:D-alanyl-D-alanine carboxypeptidase (penicillin-binding protein 5/6)
LLRRFSAFLLSAFLLAGSVLPASAQMPQPPDVAAKAYLLMDVTSGQVLASMNPDQSVEPASLTKLMTAYIVFDALKAG